MTFSNIINHNQTLETTTFRLTRKRDDWIVKLEYYDEALQEYKELLDISINSITLKDALKKIKYVFELPQIHPMNWIMVYPSKLDEECDDELELQYYVKRFGNTWQ